MGRVAISDFKYMTEGTVLKIFPSASNEGEKPLVGEYRGYKQGMGNVDPANDQIIILTKKDDGSNETIQPAMHEIGGFEIIEAVDWK